MNKLEMAKHITATYKGISQRILLAKLDYLKSGKFYGWNVEGKRYRLINKRGSFAIEEV
jgi:hypothetical protein